MKFEQTVKRVLALGVTVAAFGEIASPAWAAAFAVTSTQDTAPARRTRPSPAPTPARAPTP